MYFEYTFTCVFVSASRLSSHRCRLHVEMSFEKPLEERDQLRSELLN
jgi:hypothetical protein